MEPTFSTIVCWLYEFRGPAATVIAALVASIVAPWIGLSIYHRQKEYELVRKRYLDNGLDIIVNNAEFALGVFRHNWARSLSALKHFRDTGADMPKDLYQSGYVELAPTSYNTSHSFILHELAADPIFHEAQQLLYSFVTNSNAFFVFDVCSAIRIGVEGGKEIKLEASRETMADEYFKELKELDTKSNKFYELLRVLYEMSGLLSRQRLNFETVEKFKEQSVIKNRIKELTDLFSADLKKHKTPDL